MQSSTCFCTLSLPDSFPIRTTSCLKQTDTFNIYIYIYMAPRTTTFQNELDIQTYSKFSSHNHTLKTICSKICNISYWITQKSLLTGELPKSPITFKYIVKYWWWCFFFNILCAPCYINSGEKGYKVRQEKLKMFMFIHDNSFCALLSACAYLSILLITIV
jgi:hypothetical protein